MQTCLLSVLAWKIQPHSEFISALQEASNPDSPFNDLQLNKCISNMFAAGSETTATTLRWALLLMMKFTDVQGQKMLRDSSTVFSIIIVPYT